MSCVFQCDNDGSWSDYIGSCSDDGNETEPPEPPTTTVAAPTTTTEAPRCDGPNKDKKVGVKMARAKTNTAEGCKMKCMANDDCLQYNWKRKKCVLTIQTETGGKKGKRTFSGSCN